MLRAALALAALSLATPAGAAVLYKSVDDKGVVMFSDMPPAAGVEAKRLVVPESSAAVPGALRSADATPVAPTTRVEQTYLGDEAVQRASLQVDLAEHALAVARRPLWEVADPMKLTGPKMSRADQERVEHYQKNLKIAKQQLADLLRTKLAADTTRTMTAEAGAPIYGPSSPIYRR
jgi:hypothetical protein